MRLNKLGILLLVLAFSSCQKVIQVDLNEANPAYVIEATLYDGTHDVEVRISKTSNYFGTAQPPVVNDAVVTLIDGNNVSHSVPLSGDGRYVLPGFTATPLQTYTLQVQAGGKTFTAQSTLPQAQAIDSVTYQDFGGFGGGPGSPGGGAGKGSKLMSIHFRDSLGVKNYYRVLITRNDTLLNNPGDYYVFDDLVRDGQYIDAPLFPNFVETGDTVDVELRCMDKGVFTYFITLGDILTSDANNGAAPANPVSNFDQGALGYFGAFSRNRVSFRVQ